jgi:ubiquinone/menaquinone biosynthesis C-methylase UbiE
MARHVRLRERLVGIEGLALLRHLYEGSDADADRRLAEIRRLLDDERFAGGEPIHEASVITGYGAWSKSYDEPGNPVIALEQPAVWSFIDRLPPGRALDAACGTGRHARHLVERGHDVLGVDLTQEMLVRARENAPAARFEQADLRAIPAEDGELDLAVCGLAIAHLDNLDAGVAELARVLRRGGHLVVSALHPFQAHLGWHAPFALSNGERGFVREHDHTHADYLNAFRAAGLNVSGCKEPALTEHELAAKRSAFAHIPQATAEAYLGLPAVLVWDVEKR